MHGLPVWSPSPPDLYGCPGSRETPARPALSREMMGPRPLGVSDALASATCGDLCVSPPGQRRRLSATGRGDRPSYSFFQSCYRNPFGQHGQGSAAVVKSHPWFLIFARLPGQRPGEPRALLTSRVARSRLAWYLEAVACKVGFHERCHVENTALGRQRARGHAVDENREDGEDRLTTVTSPEPKLRALRNLVVAEHAKNNRRNPAGRKHTPPSCSL